MATLDELAARLDTREQQLEVLEQLLADKHISQSTYLAGQPVRQATSPRRSGAGSIR